MKIRSIRNLKKLAGKKVLVRCDFNVAIEKKKVIDDFKIVQSLPTIRLLTSQGAKVILMTHLGRPKLSQKSKVKSQKYSLKPISARLSKLLGKNVKYVEDCTGKKAQVAVAKMKNKQIVLLENLRFYKGEEDDNQSFAKELASLADIYVNNALAVSHRKHASVSAIKKFLPSYAGLLLAKEVQNLHKVAKPTKPLVVVMGGAKIHTKMPMIKKLQKKSKAVLIGGMITYDFLAAKKLSTGKYEVDRADKKLAKKILSPSFSSAGMKVVLPVDFIASAGKRNTKLSPVNNLPANSLQLDIGPETIRLYSKYIKQAKTIIWNGPMGMFEDEQFKQGTLAIARLVASRGNGQAFVIAGGGETITALKQSKMIDHVDWVSTGGGAMLAYLAGEKMPGLKGIIK